MHQRPSNLTWHGAAFGASSALARATQCLVAQMHSQAAPLVDDREELLATAGTLVGGIAPGHRSRAYQSTTASPAGEDGTTVLQMRRQGGCKSAAGRKPVQCLQSRPCLAQLGHQGKYGTSITSTQGVPTQQYTLLGWA